jgi:nucleotide-binding universal stress UspA family protein
MTFKKILVGLDQSFKDSAVFARALEQAKPHSTSMMIFHALKVEPRGEATAIATADNDTTRDLYAMLARQHQARVERTKQKATNWLDLYFQQAIAKGIPTQVNCEAGNPGLWLCEMAQRWGADLIVVGHRDNQGLRSVGNSSVTQYVLQHAPCPILVIQGLASLDEADYFNHLETPQMVSTPGSDRLASQMFKI